MLEKITNSIYHISFKELRYVSNIIKSSYNKILFLLYIVYIYFCSEVIYQFPVASLTLISAASDSICFVSLGAFWFFFSQKLINLPSITPDTVIKTTEGIQPRNAFRKKRNISNYFV